MARHPERFHKDKTGAKAESVSGSDSAISGTYLTKVSTGTRQDAMFEADDGTEAVWILRHIDTGGKCRTFASLLDGIMASAMLSALGLRKCQPGPTNDLAGRRWRVHDADGDLLTTVKRTCRSRSSSMTTASSGLSKSSRKWLAYCDRRTSEIETSRRSGMI